MKVLLDVDGVFSDFTMAFTKVAQELGLVSEPWPTANQETWKFDFRVDPVWAVVDRSMNWWTTLCPLIGHDEIETVNAMMWEHQTFFVTNRQSPKVGANVEDQTRFWLESIGIKLPAWSFVIATDDKARVAKELKIDLALDDKVANLEVLKDAGVTAVARGWQYNQEWEPRVSSLTEFCERFVNGRD